MAEEQIAALAHAEHGALLGTRADPLWQVVTRWPRAIPQYTLGHLTRVARAQVLEQALPGVHPVSYTHLDVYKRQPRPNQAPSRQ